MADDIIPEDRILQRRRKIEINIAIPDNQTLQP